MKKLTISFLAVIFSIGAAFSQPVSDFGIIPIGVTLNSILRLNVTSGGNIEYVVNTLQQYTDGFSADDLNPAYITTFTVASSTNFVVQIYTDAADFVGVDNATGANSFAVDMLGYSITYEGTTGVVADYTLTPVWAVGAAIPITTTAADIVADNGANNIAGDINKNAFGIHWELGTANNGIAGPLLGQSADRYVVNAFIDLVGL